MRAAAIKAAPVAEKTPWMLFAFIAFCFFIVGHDISASTKFNAQFEAESLEEAGEGQGESQGWRQLGGLALGGFGAAALVLSQKQALKVQSGLAIFMLFFLAWAMMSVFWAEDKGQTLRRVMLLTFLCLGGAAASKRMSLDDAMLFFLVCPLAYLGIGILAELAQGTFRPLPLGYRFSGTQHPNSQAVNCGLLLIAALAWLRRPDARRNLTIAVALGTAYFVLLAGSRTALGSLLAAVGLWYAFGLKGTAKFFVLSLAAAGFVCFVLFGDAAQAFLESSLELGRDDTADTLGSLSGRVPLWAQLSGFMLERPLLGYGYGAFWTPARIEFVMSEQGWPLSHAHNAYIDVMLELGPLGALSFALMLILGARRSYVLARDTGHPIYTYFGMLFLFVMLNGFMESVAIQRTQLTFFLMLAWILLAFHEPAKLREAAA